jgi:hypothetical protein
MLRCSSFAMNRIASSSRLACKRRSLPRGPRDFYPGLLGRDGHLADFENARGDDGLVECRMAKFKVHPAAKIGSFEHRAAPVRSADLHSNRMGTVNRVTTDEDLSAAASHNRVKAVLSVNLQLSVLREIVKVHSTFDR